MTYIMTASWETCSKKHCQEDSREKCKIFLRNKCIVLAAGVRFERTNGARTPLLGLQPSAIDRSTNPPPKLDCLPRPVMDSRKELITGLRVFAHRIGKQDAVGYYSSHCILRERIYHISGH